MRRIILFAVLALLLLDLTEAQRGHGSSSSSSSGRSRGSSSSSSTSRVSSTSTRRSTTSSSSGGGGSSPWWVSLIIVGVVFLAVGFVLLQKVCRNGCRSRSTSSYNNGSASISSYGNTDGNTSEYKSDPSSDSARSAYIAGGNINPKLAEFNWPSGSWTGFFVEDGRRDDMALTLMLQEGKMHGRGTDFKSFSISGVYSELTGRVAFLKKYDNYHGVEYEGSYDMMSNTMTGTWKLVMKRNNSVESGTFHLTATTQPTPKVVAAPPPQYIPTAPAAAPVNYAPPPAYEAVTVMAPIPSPMPPPGPYSEYGPPVAAQGTTTCPNCRSAMSGRSCVICGLQL